MEQIKIKLPEMKFDLKCPRCGQMWSRLTDKGICFDCDNEKSVKVEVVKEIKPDSVVGANDAIKFRADIDG